MKVGVVWIWMPSNLANLLGTRAIGDSSLYSAATSSDCTFAALQHKFGNVKAIDNATQSC